MNIDVHSHYIPRELEHNASPTVEISSISDGLYGLKVDGSPAGPLPKGAFDIESRLEDMDRMDIDVQVLSATHHLFLYTGEPRTAAKVARMQNEAIARAVKGTPDRFVGNATLPLQDPRASVEELRHAISELGLRGVEIGTNVGGRNLDWEGLRPFYEEVEKTKVPVLVHPNDIMAPERHKDYYGRIVVGTLAETNNAILSVIFGGVLDLYPGLKFIFCHGGGGIPYHLGRLQHAMDTRKECKGRTRHDVRHYFDTMCFDTVLFDGKQLKHLMDVAPHDNVLLGTDYPFDMGDWDSAELVKSTVASEPDREKVLHSNCSRIYRLG